MEENTKSETLQMEVVPPSALESLERAQVDCQIATAHRYPRSLSVVKKKMLELATLDEETASSCFYRLNRQGKSIEGPSIRLAEIAASSFGNIRAGARIIGNDGKQITAQGFCHDLEGNVLFNIEVKRRITDRNGNTYSDDMQVVTGNAACAIAARNAIFKVVPFAFVKPIFLAAKKTAVGDATTLADRRTKMLEKFAQMGINDKRVFASVEKAGIEEIGLHELEILIGVHNAIRDGDQSIDEAFPEPKPPLKFGGEFPVVSTPEDKTKVKKKETKTETEPARATPLQAVRNLMASSKIEEGPLLAHLFSQMLIEQGQTLEKMSEPKLQAVIDNWIDIATAIQKG